MKDLIARITQIILLFALPITLAAQPNCSIMTVAGTWAASSQGVFFKTISQLDPPVMRHGAAAGLVSITADGGVFVTLTGNVNGNVAPVTMQGTVEINSDCTGTLTAMTNMGWAMKENLLVMDHGDEVRTISTGGMFNSPAVWQCTWKRVARVPMPIFEAVSNCSAHMLRGTWAGNFTGVVLIPGQEAPAQTAMQNKMSIGIQQQFRGNLTASIDGAMSSYEWTGSIVEVKPDCTGTLEYKLTGPDGLEMPVKAVEKIVILDGGKGFVSLPVQGPIGIPIGLGRYSRISPVPVN